MTAIPNNALVVVADGAGARLFRAVSEGGRLSLTNEKTLSPKDLADEGPSGSRPEEQTPRQTDEATFAKQLAQALFTMHHANQFSDLVLIADPQTLGQVREVLHKTVEGSLVKTLAKDFTNHAVADIVAALA